MTNKHGAWGAVFIRCSLFIRHSFKLCSLKHGAFDVTDDCLVILPSYVDNNFINVVFRRQLNYFIILDHNVKSWHFGRRYAMQWIVISPPTDHTTFSDNLHVTGIELSTLLGYTLWTSDNSKLSLIVQLQHYKYYKIKAQVPGLLAYTYAYDNWLESS